MHVYARSVAFNEQNIAAMRKLLAPGPLQVWPRFPTNERHTEAERGAAGRGPTAERAARRAAVLVPLCNHNGVASLLFTVRSNKVSTHRGQVSFPGGHIEPEEGPVEAALRETIEEVGANLGHVEVIGTFGEIPAPSGTMVTPVVGFVHEDIGPRLSDLALSPDEVESVFTLSVSELLDPAFRVVDDLGPRGKVPAFTAGPHRVWGLTAMVIDGVLGKAILPCLRAEVTPASGGEVVVKEPSPRKGTDISSL